MSSRCRNSQFKIKYLYPPGSSERWVGLQKNLIWDVWIRSCQWLTDSTGFRSRCRGGGWTERRNLPTRACQGGCESLELASLSCHGTGLESRASLQSPASALVPLSVLAWFGVGPTTCHWGASDPWEIRFLALTGSSCFGFSCKPRAPLWAAAPSLFGCWSHHDFISFVFFHSYFQGQRA